jgi:hypothetical protein
MRWPNTSPSRRRQANEIVPTCSRRCCVAFLDFWKDPERVRRQSEKTMIPAPLNRSQGGRRDAMHRELKTGDAQEKLKKVTPTPRQGSAPTA